MQVARLRKADVIVIDELSMLDWYLFRTAEGLCRKFCKKGMSGKPYGVVDMSSYSFLLYVGQRDIYGTTLGAKFSVLVLREVKRATDPVLASVLQ